MQPQLGLPGRWCDREALGTQGRGKQPRDCDICGELMRGGVLLSIPTRYRWKRASLGAPGKRQSGTTQKMRCSKIFGRRAQLEQSPKKVKTSLLPQRGFLASPGSRVGCRSGEGRLRTTIRSFPEDGTAWPRWISARPMGLSAAAPRRADSSGLALGSIWCWRTQSDTVCASLEPFCP